MKNVRLAVKGSNENAKFIKAYAKENKTSVSKLTDAYFSKLIAEDENEIPFKQNTSSK